MRLRFLFSTLLILVGAGLVLSQPAERPKVFIGLGGEPTPDDKGILVRDVTADGPAAKAGIKPGDLIVKVGDKAVKGFDTMGEALASKKPGDKIGLTLSRDGKEQAVELTLTAPAANAQLGPAPAGVQLGGGFLGVVLQELTPDLKSRLGVAVDKGALITDVLPNSPAGKAELRDGDVIVALDGNAIETAQALRDAIKAAGPNKKVAFKVVRGAKQMDVGIQLEEMTADKLVPRPPTAPPRAVLPTPLVPESQRIKDLEKKVQDLEKRLAELEKKGAKPE
jgi:serine protease Do